MLSLLEHEVPGFCGFGSYEECVAGPWEMLTALSPYTCVPVPEHPELPSF